jgi:BASS family bile acid:Na+ symporter
MSLAQIIQIVLKVSIALIVFSLALQTRSGDLASVLRRPGLLLRSILSMFVVMPAVAVALATLFDLRPELKVALVLLAMAPVPPVLPGKQGKAGGNLAYAIGLLMTAALLSIVTVPVTAALIGSWLGLTVRVPMSLVATVVGTTAIIPLMAGAIVRQWLPRFAERAAGPLSKLATLLLLAAFMPFLIKSWPAIFAAVGDLTLVAITLFTVVGLLVGHALGGPEPENRTVLALATASRHPGVAMGIAGSVAAPEVVPAIVATVLLAVLVGLVVTGPYVMGRRRAHLASASAPPQPA